MSKNFAVVLLGLMGMIFSVIGHADHLPVDCFKQAKPLMQFAAHEPNIKYATLLCQNVRNVAETVRCFAEAKQLLKFSGHEYNIKYAVALCQRTEQASTTLSCFTQAKTLMEFAEYEYNIKYAVELCAVGSSCN